MELISRDPYGYWKIGDGGTKYWIFFNYRFGFQSHLWSWNRRTSHEWTMHLSLHEYRQLIKTNRWFRYMDIEYLITVTKIGLYISLESITGVRYFFELWSGIGVRPLEYFYIFRNLRSTKSWTFHCESFKIIRSSWGSFVSRSTSTKTTRWSGP